MLFNKYRERLKTVFNKEKILSFLDKQGFYIVLFICISIIGVTALLTTGKETYPQDGVDGDTSPLEEIADEGPSSNLKEDGQNLEDIDIKVKDVVNDDEKEEQDNARVTDSSNFGSEKYIDNEQSEVKQDSSESFQKTSQEDNNENQITKEDNNNNEVGNIQDNTDVNPVISQQGASKIMMIHPVEGEVIKEYSMDELIYSKTLKEWTTHSGMDIESFLGAEVKAAMDGIVEKIEEDPLMGIMITLDHGDGIKTRYANLSTANMVEENQKVKAGQVISGVGRTAGAEILDPTHLHFELIIDGEYVNPAEYLK